MIFFSWRRQICFKLNQAFRSNRQMLQNLKPLLPVTRGHFDFLTLLHGAFGIKSDRSSYLRRCDNNSEQ